VKKTQLSQGEDQITAVILTGFFMEELKGAGWVRDKLPVQIKAVEDKTGLAANLAFHSVRLGLPVGDTQAGLGGADGGGAAGE
jgi:hypothetical protein